MTFREGAEIVLRKVAGGDIPNDFPIKEEEVVLIMQNLIPLLLKKDYINTYNIEKRLTDSTLFTTFIADVYQSNIRSESYAVLPSAPNFLFGTAIPQVTWAEDRFSGYTYIDSGQLANIHSVGLLSEVSGGVFTYEHVSGCDTEHRLVFFNIDDCVKQVRVRMVQSLSFENADLDAQIPIKTDLMYELLDEAYRWFVPQSTTPEDKTMDNRKDKI